VQARWRWCRPVAGQPLRGELALVSRVPDGDGQNRGIQGHPGTPTSSAQPSIGRLNSSDLTGSRAVTVA